MSDLKSGFLMLRGWSKGNVSVNIASLKESLALPAAALSAEMKTLMEALQMKVRGDTQAPSCPPSKCARVRLEQNSNYPNYAILVWQDCDCWLTSPGFVGQVCAHIKFTHVFYCLAGAARDSGACSSH